MRLAAIGLRRPRPLPKAFDVTGLIMRGEERGGQRWTSSVWWWGWVGEGEGRQEGVNVLYNYTLTPLLSCADPYPP